MILATFSIILILSIIQDIFFPKINGREMTTEEKGYMGRSTAVLFLAYCGCTLLYFLTYKTPEQELLILKQKHEQEIEHNRYCATDVKTLNYCNKCFTKDEDIAVCKSQIKNN